MQIKSYLLFFILTTACFLQSCTRCDRESGDFYEFTIPFQLTPIKDTYKIGDTITLSANFEDELFDEREERHYRLEDFNFRTNFNILRIDTSELYYAESHFEYLNSREQVIFVPLDQGVGYVGVNYDYQNNNYQFELQFIPLIAGDYWFEIYTINDATRKPSSVPLTRGCAPETHYFYYMLNDNQTQKNYDLVANSGDPLVNTVTEEDFRSRTNTITFSVEEK